MRNRGERPQMALTVDVVLSFAAAFLLEALVSKFSVRFALARNWAPTQGGVAGMSDLALARALLAPGHRVLEEVHTDFVNEARDQNRICAWISVIIGTFSSGLIVSSGIARMQIGASMILTGVVLVLVQIWKPSPPDIQQQRELLRSIGMHSCCSSFQVRWCFFGDRRSTISTCSL